MEVILARGKECWSGDFYASPAWVEEVQQLGLRCTHLGSSSGTSNSHRVVKRQERKVNKEARKITRSVRREERKLLRSIRRGKGSLVEGEENMTWRLFVVPCI